MISAPEERAEAKNKLPIAHNITMVNRMRRFFTVVKTRAIILAVIWLAVSVQANGLYGDGTGAAAMAMGGADVAWAADPLGAMGDNPAGLGFLDAPELSLGGEGAVLQGRFNKPGVSSGDVNQSPNGLPEGAFAMPLSKWPVTLGISCVPDSALLADWHYPDPPGGLLGTTSYGNQEDKSEIVVLRSALGAAVRVNSKWSFGGSVGLIYNQNELVTPYIFQNLQPSSAYDGAKTLLDLRTSGFGWNYQLGIIYQALTNLQFGVTYKGESTVDTTGDATGDPYAQFGVAPGPLAFHYDANVKNKFPQEVSAGLSWKFYPKWRLALQTDWIDWADAFNTLPVKLGNGSNPGVNAALGSSFQDNIPLDWKDEFVYRAGLEFAVLKNLSLRTGYSYGGSPVPNSTLTPLTAAILEQAVSAGVGYRWGRWDFDLAYQYDLPVTQDAGTSSLRSGEYSNSSTEVSAHWLALTVNIHL
jgi:long-subunit fatty acid transport protein